MQINKVRPYTPLFQGCNVLIKSFENIDVKDVEKLAKALKKIEPQMDEYSKGLNVEISTHKGGVLKMLAKGTASNSQNSAMKDKLVNTERTMSLAEIDENIIMKLFKDIVDKTRATVQDIEKRINVINNSYAEKVKN